MFKKFTNGCVTLVQKFLPDPFIFASILTIIVYIAGIFLTKQGPLEMLVHWNKGFWSLLSFGMQMALIVVTGHTLASTPIANKGIKKLASIPKKPWQAIALTTLVGGIACWINWGFGLILGAIFAKEVARKVKGVDYRLLIASAYSGFVVWHGGLSGSIPLTIATGGKEVEAVSAGVITSAISTAETIFTPYNIIMVLAILIVLPIINCYMHPKGEEIFEIDPKLLEEDTKVVNINASDMTPAQKLENSPIISTLVGIMGIAYIIYYFATNGFKLDLNVVNFAFLFLSILFHGTPRKFLNAAANGVKATTGIIVQFPFYAGIMGMMVGANASGISLGGTIANGIISIANETTLPILATLSTAFCTIFIPSGGGEWALQAPIIMPAAQQLGVSASVAAMSIAWGDAWACLIQPFWALPALAIAGLNARDIMGFCIVDLLVTGVIIFGSLLLLV